MGEKKQKEAAQKKWKKVLFVVAAILFVVVMVVSSMGTYWITGIAPIKAGDQVAIDYTLYSATGAPVITTNQQTFKQMLENGQGVMYSNALTLTANRSATQALTPVSVYVPTGSGSWQQFAFYNPEIDALSNGVSGMRTGESKKVTITYPETMSRLFTEEDLAAVNMNMSSLSVGDTLSLGVSDNPNSSVSDATTYIRLGDVTRKTDAGVVVDFGYPYAEITVKSFTNS